jgi:CheY-specific phosphatase CheX
MNTTRIQAAYQIAVQTMMQASPEMPREVAEAAVDAIATLVIATIAEELDSEGSDNATHH